MENVGIFYAHLEYIMAILCILWSFGNFVVILLIFPVLVHCVKKNLATLIGNWNFLVFFFARSETTKWNAFFLSILHIQDKWPRPVSACHHLTCHLLKTSWSLFSQFSSFAREITEFLLSKAQPKHALVTPPPQIWKRLQLACQPIQCARARTTQFLNFTSLKLFCCHAFPDSAISWKKPWAGQMWHFVFMPGA
jgi:hypothetical protein